jgi:mannose-1-phosphate guanylyltransferase
MKAILLAGGQGSRLRPLTITTPKPIVPIFDRPFLRYQIELLKQVPEIDEIVLSLNYQPRRIEEVFGDGTELGVSIRYVVEPQPLGTGGAIKFAAGDKPSGPIVVFNGDVLTSVDLPAVIALHRSRQAKATIVLTPVENPSAYGLVQCDEDQSVKAFLEKPTADQLAETRCDTINAGIYVIEGDTLDRIPADTVYSIERGYFPSLVARGAHRPQRHHRRPLFHRRRRRNQIRRADWRAQRDRRPLPHRRRRRRVRRHSLATHLGGPRRAAGPTRGRTALSVRS